MTNKKNGRNVKELCFFNNKIVVDLLSKKNMSCMELSKEIGLTHAALIKIINRLCEKEIVIRANKDNALPKLKGGQHVRYCLNKEKGLLVNVNLGHKQEMISIFDFSCQLIFEKKLSELFEISSHLDEDFVNKVISYIKEIVSTKFKKEILAISIAIPGQVDNETGKIVISSRFDNSINIKKLFLREFNCPIEIRNDTYCGAIGELKINKALSDNQSSALYLHIGYGISSCIINKSSLFTGNLNCTGEIGNNIVTAKGDNLHTMCAMSSLIEKFVEYGVNDITNLVSLMNKNREVEDYILNSAKLLSSEINKIINLTMVNQIIITGSVRMLGDTYLAVINKNISKVKDNIGFDVKAYYSTISSPTEEGLLLISRDIAIEELSK